MGARGDVPALRSPAGCNHLGSSHFYCKITHKNFHLVEFITKLSSLPIMVYISLRFPREAAFANDFEQWGT
jgi:hypothetical protein